MKKKYSKPDIMYESFTLSTNIASDCAPGTEMLANDYSCGKLFSDGRTVFTTNVAGCKDVKVLPDQDGDGVWGTYCYHVPVNLASIFNS